MLQDDGGGTSLLVRFKVASSTIANMVAPDDVSSIKPLGVVDQESIKYPGAKLEEIV